MVQYLGRQVVKLEITFSLKSKKRYSNSLHLNSSGLSGRYSKDIIAPFIGNNGTGISFNTKQDGKGKN
jgi:hypothetical protein